MQYWIFFAPGVGGDGFVNLLEHAEGMIPADGTLAWRVHKRIGDKIKFFGPKWTEDPIPFRQVNLRNDVKINGHYLDLVRSGTNTVIPAHYFYFQQIIDSPWKDLVEKDQVKIHLYTSDTLRAARDFATKHELRDFDVEKNAKKMSIDIEKHLRSDAYACHIDIEKAWNDWEYLRSKLADVNIKIHRNLYLEYLDIKDGKRIDLDPL